MPATEQTELRAPHEEPRHQDEESDSQSDAESVGEPKQTWKKFHAVPKIKPIDPTLSGLLRVRFEQCPIGGGGG